MVSLGNVPFFLGLRWVIIRPSWDSNCLMETEWEVSVYGRVESHFSIPSKPYHIFELCSWSLQVCLHSFSFLEQFFRNGRSWGGTIPIFFHLPISLISISHFPNHHLYLRSNLGSHLVVDNWFENPPPPPLTWFPKCWTLLLYNASNLASNWTLPTIGYNRIYQLNSTSHDMFRKQIDLGYHFVHVSLSFMVHMDLSFG